MEAFVHWNLRQEKSVKMVEKSSSLQKNRHSVPSSPIALVGVKIVRQLYLFFLFYLFFWLAYFVFLYVLSLFHIVTCRNLVVWISDWCHFCDILILFVRYWDPMEAMFSSWILSSELSGAHNLKAPRLKCRDSCFHHKQTLFAEGSIVWQQFYFFVLLINMVCLFRCIGSFLFCATSDLGCFTFNVVSFSLYLYFVRQFWGSFGDHVFVLDPVKWATLYPRAESLQFETKGLLFPSSANFVCGRQRCPTTCYTFLILLTS